MYNNFEAYMNTNDSKTSKNNVTSASVRYKVKTIMLNVHGDVYNYVST